MGNSNSKKREVPLSAYKPVEDEQRTGSAAENVHPMTGSPPSSTVFSGGGEMGERIRNFDWSKTPLGPIEQWPQALVTSIQIMLASRQPIWVGWGAPELTYFYNDPYKSIIGGRHPSALGKPLLEVWPEIRGQNESLLQRAMAGTEGIYVEAQLLIMHRHGFPEETYYTYSFTPIPNEGGFGGIFCANTDDTQRVIGQRRISLLQELAALSNARNLNDVCERVKTALATNPRDLPFALVYLLEPSNEKLVRQCAAGFSADHPVAPPSIDLNGDSLWPVAEVLQSNSPRIVDVAHYPDLPRGPWPQPPDKAVVLPLIAAGGGPAGVVIAGLNPYRQWSDLYQSFFSLVASQISSAVATARAYEAERISFEREQTARREAEDATRAKDRFLATLSHELRTPLNPVLLIASDAVADPKLPPHIRADFEVILKNIEVEAHLIDDLLDLSRIAYGKLTLKTRIVDAHRVLREALQTVEGQIESKRIQTTVELNAKQHSLLADPVRLQQVFWNILKNAVKFTPEHGKISIETFLTGDEGNSRFSVKITDSGIGMTPEELSKVFSAFTQGEHTNDGSRNYGGLGLGLAISKKLVELHSGTIQAMSDGRGRGAAFTIEFPLAKG